MRSRIISALSKNRLSEKNYGDRYDEIITTTKKNASTQKFARSDSGRAALVVADIEHPNDKFWALDNRTPVRCLLKGFPELRIRVVPLQQVNKELAQVANRWQALKAHLMQEGGSNLKKRLGLITPTFVYQHLKDDGRWRALQIRFRCASASSPQHCQLKTFDEVEDALNAILQAEANSRLDKLKRREAEVLSKAEHESRNHSVIAALTSTDDVSRDAASAVINSFHDSRVLMCPRGHEIKTSIKRVSDKCDCCSKVIQKGDQCMTCGNHPMCSWFMCSSCAAQPKADSLAGNRNGLASNFSVGERVEVSDWEDRSWSWGVVTNIDPLLIRRDTDTNSFNWKFVRSATKVRGACREEPKIEDSGPDCVVCLTNKACFLCSNGHVVVCRTCRRKLVFQKLQDTGDGSVKSPQDLNARALDRTSVPCPICRSDSPFTYIDKFSAKQYG